MVRLHARHGSRDAAAISYERFSYTVTRYPCTSAVRPSFLAGTTESPSLSGRAPSPEKQLMVLPTFLTDFWSCCSDGALLPCGYRSAAHGGVDVDSNGIDDGDC